MTKTISKNSSAKLIVEKSHFYSYIFKINDSSNIKKIIEDIKKKHKGCNHVAFAFKVDDEENYSDDGEPNKTAGMPLLNIIKNNKLDYVLICVARIFGGKKLGVSGLRSAYSGAGKLALEENEIIEFKKTKMVIKEMSLKEFSKFEKDLKKNKIKYSCDFLDDKVIVKINKPI